MVIHPPIPFQNQLAPAVIWAMFGHRWIKMTALGKPRELSLISGVRAGLGEPQPNPGPSHFDESRMMLWTQRRAHNVAYGRKPPHFLSLGSFSWS